MQWLSRLLGHGKNPRKRGHASIHVYNTLSGKKEVFVPLKPGLVLMYTCGPTVYGPAQIGNLRAYVFSDTLARTLSEAGLHVQRVINITDVGHLVGDADQGQDKMAVGALREKKTPREIADEYTKQFMDDLHDLNIDTASIRFPRATEYIREQIALAKTLEEKGFTYRLPDGLYFDTTRFVNYGRLGNMRGTKLKEGARVAKTEGKKHAADFALWRSAKPGDLQQWDSPWGSGNPGWHLECSAMSRALLGVQIDIHTGGEDHISVHHNNEIAQSEAASGRTFVRYWLHNAFLTIDGEKISKSLGNDIYLSDLIAKGHHPLALRYFFLQAHYRTPLSFTTEAFDAASSALQRLWKAARDIQEESRGKETWSDAIERFEVAMRDDLNTATALAVLWESVRSDDLTPEEKWALLKCADRYLGLMLVDAPLRTIAVDALPQEIQELLDRREKARAAKDFESADRLRAEIEKGGYRVEDGQNGPVLTKSTF